MSSMVAVPLFKVEPVSMGSAIYAAAAPATVVSVAALVTMAAVTVAAADVTKVAAVLLVS
jgi:hypothetical protein